MSIANMVSLGKWFWLLWLIIVGTLLASILIPGTSYSSTINGIKSLLAIVSIVICAVIIVKYDLPMIRKSRRKKR